MESSYRSIQARLDLAVTSEKAGALADEGLNASNTIMTNIDADIWSAT